jgi:hypothetical protein
MRILNRAKLTFPKGVVLKSNLNLSYSFSPITYDVTDLFILNKKVSFCLGLKYFRDIDIVKLNIDIEEVKD